MVKGCERRVVVYKSNDSKYFCEAYFFLKPTLDRHDCKKRDMIEEANRIIRESAFCDTKKKRVRARTLVLRVGILLFSCALSSVVTLLLCSNM